MAGSCQDSETITINPGTTMPGSNDRNRTIYQRLAAVYDLADIIQLTRERDRDARKAAGGASAATALASLSHEPPRLPASYTESNDFATSPS